MDIALHDHTVDLDTAVAFINTQELVHGEPFDHFSTTVEALDWLHHHGLIHHHATTT